MIAAAQTGRPSPPAEATPARNHFAEGLAMMREKWPIYLGFAVISGIAGINGSVDPAHPELAMQLTSLRVTAVLALIAIVFVLPAAVRRLEPAFRMTPWRFLIMFAMIATVGTVVDLGVSLALLPGIVAAVLLSQALLTALLRPKESVTAKSFVSSIVDSFRESYVMTKNRFATTLGVVLLPLVFIVVYGSIGVLGMLIAASWFPWSLYLTGPFLFLTVVYFECVRYSLLVWWYGKLRRRV